MASPLVITFAAAALWAAFLLPAAAQQAAVCVPDAAAADEASRNSGEELAWMGETSEGSMMRFYLGQRTWSVFYLRSDGQWCTAPTMVGKIRRADPA